jgi:hypothetical protein
MDGEYGVLVKKAWKSVITSWDMSIRTVIFYMPTATELLLSCRCMTRTLLIQRLLQVPHENASQEIWCGCSCAIEYRDVRVQGSRVKQERQINRQTSVDARRVLIPEDC